MTATAAPLRVTSTSSPVATRLRTSEKLRATSVAVIRDIREQYQINQIDTSAGGQMPSQNELAALAAPQPSRRTDPTTTLGRLRQRAALVVDQWWDPPFARVTFARSAGTPFDELASLISRRSHVCLGISRGIPCLSGVVHLDRDTADQQLLRQRSGLCAIGRHHVLRDHCGHRYSQTTQARANRAAVPGRSYRHRRVDRARPVSSDLLCRSNWLQRLGASIGTQRRSSATIRSARLHLDQAKRR